MTKSLWWVLPALAIAACEGPAADEKDKQDKKGVVVKIDDLKSTAPDDWKEEKPARQERVYQFRLPKVEGDKHDAELVIFFFGTGTGGSAQQNVQRWKSFFLPPEGKKIDDVAEVTKMKVGNVDVTYLDVRGTYKYKERPFDPNAKEEKRPDYRQLGVVFESPKGPYFFRLIGPAKTVAHYKKGFDRWLRAFE